MCVLDADGRVLALGQQASRNQAVLLRCCDDAIGTSDVDLAVRPGVGFPGP